MTGGVAMGTEACGPRGLYTGFPHNTGLPTPLHKIHDGLYPGLPRTLRDAPAPTFYRTSPRVAWQCDHTGASSEGSPCPLMPIRATWEAISGL